MKQEIDAIQNKLIDIMQNSFNLSSQVLNSANWNKPLLGAPFYLTAVDLVYIFLEVEKNYEIRINSKELRDYGFDTISKISNIIHTYSI